MTQLVYNAATGKLCVDSQGRLLACCPAGEQIPCDTISQFQLVTTGAKNRQPQANCTNCSAAGLINGTQLLNRFAPFPFNVNVDCAPDTVQCYYGLHSVDAPGNFFDLCPNIQFGGGSGLAVMWGINFFPPFRRPWTISPWVSMTLFSLAGTSTSRVTFLRNDVDQPLGAIDATFNVSCQYFIQGFEPCDLRDLVLRVISAP